MTVILLLTIFSLVDIFTFVHARKFVTGKPFWPFLPGGGIIALVIGYTKVLYRKIYSVKERTNSGSNKTHIKVD